MIKTFTQNDLIRFLYHETSEEENGEIKRALQYDQELTLQLEALQQTTKSLDESFMEPSTNSVEKILNYSKGVRQ